jgi:hypothetical protein
MNHRHDGHHLGKELRRLEGASDCVTEMNESAGEKNKQKQRLAYIVPHTNSANQFAAALELKMCHLEIDYDIAE